MDPFIGEIRLVGFSFAPRGWAFCDGRLVPIAQNMALYALLGTTYGGDGTNTFALPDLRGRAAIAMGASKGLADHSLGETVGLPEGSDTNTGAGLLTLNYVIAVEGIFPARD